MPERAVDTTRKPESMTVAERRDEVASILARGLVRTVRDARNRTSFPVKKVSEAGRDGLELRDYGGLTVAPQPARVVRTKPVVAAAFRGAVVECDDSSVISRPLPIRGFGH